MVVDLCPPVVLSAVEGIFWEMYDENRIAWTYRKNFPSYEAIVEMAKCQAPTST